MNEAEILIEKLMEHYGVFSFKELSPKINIAESTISKWKQRDTVKPIKKLMSELNKNAGEKVFDYSNKDTQKNEVLTKEQIKITIEKIRLAMSCKTFEELANELNISLSTVDNWKKRGSIPNRYLMQVNSTTGVSLDWLLSEDTSIVTANVKESKEMISLLDIVSPEELEKLNKTATDSNIPLKNLLRLGVFKMGLL